MILTQDHNAYYTLNHVFVCVSVLVNCFVLFETLMED